MGGAPFGRRRVGLSAIEDPAPLCVCVLPGDKPGEPARGEPLLEPANVPSNGWSGDDDEGEVGEVGGLTRVAPLVRTDRGEEDAAFTRPLNGERLPFLPFRLPTPLGEAAARRDDRMRSCGLIC